MGAGKSRFFYSREIDAALFSRINGISYRENAFLGIQELRYLRLLHRDCDGRSHVGELIVNRRIAKEVLGIMEELYESRYPIEKMVLIEAYQGEDSRSMADNNSSGFHYRVIAGTNRLSIHSFGNAVDINPKYNPCVRTGDQGETVIEPAGSEAYADRTGTFPYKIVKNDLCCRLFAQHGFAWGGDWSSLKDYQHFEKKPSG